MFDMVSICYWFGLFCVGVFGVFGGFIILCVYVCRLIMLMGWGVVFYKN